MTLTFPLRENREALGGLRNPGLLAVSHPLPAQVLMPSHLLSLLPQYQGFQVQLESVKKVNELEGQWVPSPGLQTQSPQPSVCHHPALPLDLQPICASGEADSIFQALRNIAADDCELCVNVACTGCS
ncbi:guanylate cyclase activator 2B isoform X1 [Eschrichtius robustus]|uniref:guanylate cyclase activator 2B isoform X1 n=1 Tax=Eschrichtius robustus TaxID=9764 RepID=UPI0035C07666